MGKCFNFRFLLLLWSFTVSTGPGPGLLQSNVTSVWSGNIFCTRLSPRVAFALLFLFISYKPHFTSATKKKVIDVTASIGWISDCRAISACMRHFQHQKVSKQQSNPGIYWVLDSIWVEQVQITDVPESVEVYCGRPYYH